MNKKTLITGGSGLLGTALQRQIPEATALNSKDCDLRDKESVERLFEKYRPNFVYHLAARVGGIKDNSDNNGVFFRDNLLINANVLEAARKHRVTKMCSVLSTCIYPADVELPLHEKDIHKGEPHPSNFGYAYAKRMLEVQSRAYREQWGCNFICAIPNNLYGPNDNFDLEKSHVIPALIRKIYEARQRKKKIQLWGDGSPRREFTFSEDIAKILCFLMTNYNEKDPINIGNTEEISILGLAQLICDIFGYDAHHINWDTSYPAGQQRKPSSDKVLKSILTFPYTPLAEGLRTTCKWFEASFPNVRGTQ